MDDMTASQSSQIARLMAQVAALQGEQEMRAKLEKLLEVQTIQVDLQKELRMKTESLLQVEQHTTSKLRQQLDELRRAPVVVSRTTMIEDSLSAARARIQDLEKQLLESRAPETSDRVESQLKKQLEEQEQIINNLRRQMAGTPPNQLTSAGEGEVVRLQMLLQSRDKHLDELSKSYHKTQQESSQVRYEADVLRQQVRVLREEVSERTEEIQRQLSCERNLRAEIFSLKDKLEKMEEQDQDNAKRTSKYAETASKYEEEHRRVLQLEKDLLEERSSARQERQQLAAECERTVGVKESTIKHQTMAIESLNRELKEKQAEIDKLLRLLSSDVAASPSHDSRRQNERGGLLPPLLPSSPSSKTDDFQAQRSLESLHKQLRAKDGKIAKQSERLQALTEMLEQRDLQLEELSTARRDREQMRQRLSDMEEAVKTQPRVVSHAEAERRLIQQETRLREYERQVQEMSSRYEGERQDKDSLSKELSTLRGRLAQGVSSSGAVEVENSKLSKEIINLKKQLEEQTEQLRRLHHSAAVSEVKADEQMCLELAAVTPLPAVQRRLQKLEEVDRNLGRDLMLHLQEREGKIESLNSTIALLRSTVDELQSQMSRPSVPLQRSLAAVGVGTERPSSPVGVGVGTDVIMTEGVAVGTDTVVRDTTPGIACAVGPDQPWPLAVSTGTDPAMPMPSQSLHAAANTSRPTSAGNMLPPGQSSVAVGIVGAILPPPSPRGPLPPVRRPSSQEGQLHGHGGPRTSPLGLDATRQPGLPFPVPQGGVAANALAASATAPPQGSVVVDGVFTTEDLRTMSIEQVRQELIARRMQNSQLQSQLEENKQLVMKLIEETNLCNAEVASLKQTLQQSFKAARKQNKNYEDLAEQKAELEQLSKNLQQMLDEKEQKYTKMFEGIQQDTGGNQAVDQVDQKVTWKLKTLAPRRHEIRNSVFIVINRHSQVLDKLVLAQGLASQLAISASRIKVVDDARLPDHGGDREIEFGASQTLVLESEHASLDDTEMRRSVDTVVEAPEDTAGANRDLILVNISDSELNKAGEMVSCNVSALDVLEQIRNDLLHGQRINPIDGMTIDAVFINHGDIVLPFEWPVSQAKLLLREGRVLAGKHAVVTMHEIQDPYVLRVVAYDTEAGHEFLLHLYARDVALLLDTRDCEAAQAAFEAGASEPFQPMEGQFASLFRETFSVASQEMLDIIIGSLSFSVFQNQQILVASEMRIPLARAVRPSQAGFANTLSASHSYETLDQAHNVSVSPSSRHAEVASPQMAANIVPMETGVTRGLRPHQRQCKCLFEDVLTFEGRSCVFSMTHITTQDMEEDLLRVVLYYPKTCAQVEVNLWQPMLSDRLRVVGEAGELDHRDSFNIAIVIEEIVYPPAFAVRLTSITLADAFKVSPKEDAKPHTHIIRVSKDGNSALLIPDVSFAIAHSTMRTKLLKCITLSTPVQCPRESMITMPTVPAGTLRLAGHVNDPQGLRMQLLGGQSVPSSPVPESNIAASTLPALVRAQLRSKYGKGKQLLRRGIRLPFNGTADEAVRCVVTAFERQEPYQHFVVCAYEPQTSREWEVLADSIDVFKLFAGKDDGSSPALDLTNPTVRREVAEILMQSAELQYIQDELLLTISAPKARSCLAEKKRQRKVATMKDRDRTPEISGTEDASPTDERQSKAISPLAETFDVQPGISNIRTKAVVGFSGGDDRDRDIVVEQRGRDRLFCAQRRMTRAGTGEGELFKIQIFDAPLTTKLHSYVVLATSLETSALAASGLPVAIPAEANLQGQDSPSKETSCAYTVKVDDHVLEDLLWDSNMLDPSRQEELLHFISQCVCLDEDRNGQIRLCLRKPRLKAHELAAGGARTAALAAADHSAKAACAHAGGIDSPDSLYSREVGGCYPLVRLKRAKASKPAKSAEGAQQLQGPSFTDHDKDDRKFLARDWQKLHRIEQHWGGSSVVITVSRRGLTFKIGVYEPKSSSNYEMCLATAASSSPLNILIERCELTSKLDLLLCIYEISFPHTVTIIVEHIPTQQEFRLTIGDDEVFTMIENSRKDAFTMFLDQLIHCGCVGGGGAEDQALATIFEETFAGNQIFNRYQEPTDIPSLTDGDAHLPPALAPAAQRKQRIPVIRTQLDFMGNTKTGKAAETVVGGLTTNLLYHAEHCFGKDGETLMLRVHKKVNSGDIAFTLRSRNQDGLSAPTDPSNRHLMLPPKQDDNGTNGRAFNTPSLGIGEVSHGNEVTIWMQDKCSYAPCGIYGEFVEVPGLSKQVAILISDEDNPRAVRVAVVLAQLPFTVLFQAVLLDNSETAAKVDLSSDLKSTAGRKVLKSFFERTFSPKGALTSGVLTHLASEAESQRRQDLCVQLDALEDAAGKLDSGMGIENGPGTGGPINAVQSSDPDQSPNVAILYMCTRKKLGRMMVFTVFRDIIAHHMYLRVVMHDPTVQRDCHLTLLHYTTQKLLATFRINRDMLEDSHTYHNDSEKQERQQLRAELGKIIVNHLYLQRSADHKETATGEAVDDLELLEHEDLDYELKMRDIVDPSNAAELSVRFAMLDQAKSVLDATALGLDDPASEKEPNALNVSTSNHPRTLLEMTEENLLYKGEQDVSGRRVLVAFYNETTKEDILLYSHNFRVVAACVQTLDVLAVQDFHEETLELVCARRNKRHLMSAAREHELAKELWDALVLHRKGQQVTGISLQGMDG